MWIHADGAIKTFALRGIKDSPPYLHDGRRGASVFFTSYSGHIYQKR